jgi:omega-6 fatty acid desaturase (delta-12 desaturase)
MYFVYFYAPFWIVPLMAIPTAAFMVRLFILHHDCGHGSFFRSKAANDIVGIITGAMTLTPYQHWRWTHAMHHGSSGDLDHRGYGDIPTFTISEYYAMSPIKRLIYRIYRFPLVIFGVLPLFIFAIYQRFPVGLPKTHKKARMSVQITNVIILAYAALMIFLLGFWSFFWVHVPFAALASSMGIWLFYVQHQYEKTYWQRHDKWDFARAAMAGSSFYVLPKWMQWFTANIGLHHIHHLDSRIPNYNLQRCYDENEVLQQCEKLTLWQSLRCANLKLWDEVEERMVTFAEAAKLHRERSGVTA